MPLTSAMSCHDITDTAGNSEKLILTDISSFKTDLLKQPKLTSYPKSRIGGVGDNSRARCFQFNWFQKYPWLEYPQTKDAAFFIACRHFAPSGSRKECVFTTTGFRRWKKAQDSDSGFKKYVKSETHNSAMMRWNAFKTMVDQSTLVHQMVSEAYEKKVHENRYYIKTIGVVLLLTATQDVAQRGHREASSDSNANTGNFLQILELVARHDEIVMKKIASAPKNANTPVTKYKMRLLTFLVDLCNSLFWMKFVMQIIFNNSG